DENSTQQQSSPFSRATREGTARPEEARTTPLTTCLLLRSRETHEALQEAALRSAWDRRAAGEALVEHGTSLANVAGVCNRRSVSAPARASTTGVVRPCPARALQVRATERVQEDRKSTRLNSSHVAISYAVFCLKKK